MTNELRVHNVSTLPTDGVRMLAINIKESECPRLMDSEKYVNDEEKHTLKIFSPRFRTAQQWDKDCVLSFNNS